MAVDPDLTQLPTAEQAAPQAEGRPNQVDPATTAPQPDKQYWLTCLDDAERAERDWRKRGRDIVQIYRNEAKTGAGKNLKSQGITFNILYANTEVMLPAIYMKPPDPVVRSRFTNIPPPQMPMMPPGMLPPPMNGAPGMPPGVPPPPAPGGALDAVPPAAPGGPLPSPAAMPPVPGPAAGPPVPPPAGTPPGGAPIMLPPAGPQGPVGGPMGMPGLPASPLGQPPLPAPLGPELGPPPGPLPADVETAAAVIEKTLEIVVDDEHSHEAIKMAIKDVLLPGRGTARVRWKPQMKTFELPGGPLPDGTTPTEERKVWEEVGDEYVFWEDFLCDPVRQAADTRWVAFRHLFAEEELVAEFQGSSTEFDALVAAGKVSELLRWTDEMAAKSPPGGGAGMKTAKDLGDHIRKAMLWEIWDKVSRRVIWLCRDAGGLVMRVDPDTLQLMGFFPCPVPMLAVTTSDSRIPRAFYDLYARMAEDLDNVSVRISRLTDQVKVRGAYNSANNDVADLLKADDGKMIGVDGVDLMSGGLQNHIWLVPIADFITALDKLYLARDQLKQQIYEVMGISDIMRGATKASETATAQRIKGSMGVTRLEDAKQQAGNFVRDLLRLKAEIICQNFDAETLAQMTGENVTPAVMAILRSDFQRTCSIDIEADSTVAVDEQAEQESMAMVMQSVQAVMQGTQGMLMTGILPPQQVIQLSLELLKMFLHPVRFSRGVIEMINTFQEQLMAMPPGMPMVPPAPPPSAPPSEAQAGGPPQPQGGPPKLPNGAAGEPQLNAPPGTQQLAA